MKKIFYLILIINFNSYVFAQPFKSKGEWEKYFDSQNKTLNPIEGIWFVKSSSSVTITNEESNYFSDDKIVAVISSGYNIFKIYYIDDKLKINESNNKFFEFTQTDNYIYNDRWIKSDEQLHREFVKLSAKTMRFMSWNKTSCNGRACATAITHDTWNKIYPTKENVTSSSKSGTGFAISSNGIIATNYHVIEGGNTIKIRGVKSNFSKSYKAKVLISDKNNDLSLLQIEDNSFTNLGIIPYTIKTSLDGVGENIFVLGYPLRATMGDEIKLTNGIISSKTGFQGDITTYQISAPIQPGNSGGPLFDNQGNIIGIINAKHMEAENASYAIKSSYLTSLMELLSTPAKLQTINLLKGKSLTNQVELIKNFVYIIEVN
jgi:S1-C subfamily serine protease